MAKYDVIIIGAGAAGLMCAIEAGKRGRKVMLVEHSKNIAEKIRISGGGRCNFTNLHASPKNYISQNPHFCVSALKRYTQHDFINLVKKHNIAYHEKTLGQLFCDGSSKQIIDMLLAECRAANVHIFTSAEVQDVSKGDKFELLINGTQHECDSLVVACGGLSIPKIGATGFGYEIARKFGLNVLPTRAGLVPFVLGENILAELKDLVGVSFYGSASCNNNSFTEGMLFTHKGLSGPAILQISSYWEKGEVAINLTDKANVLEELKKLRTANPKQELKTALSNLLTKKLASYICGASTEKMADLSNKRLEEIAQNVTAWKVKPIGTEGYRTAEVTIGGVDTDGLSSKTMEAKKVPGLYFIGEVVDVTGWLGGYNFQWAWSSGFTAGQFA